VSCPEPWEEGKDFLGATWRVRCVCLLFCKSSFVKLFFGRDTLEQIDVAKSLIEKYPQVSILLIRARDTLPTKNSSDFRLRLDIRRREECCCEREDCRSSGC